MGSRRNGASFKYGKVNNEVGEIVLYDIVDCNGVSRGLKDIDSKPEIKCYKREEELLLALKCSNLVLMVSVQTHSIIADDASFDASVQSMRQLLRRLSKLCLELIQNYLLFTSAQIRWMH